jgi:hypothetical protein
MLVVITQEARPTRPTQKCQPDVVGPTIMA